MLLLEEIRQLGKHENRWVPTLETTRRHRQRQRGHLDKEMDMREKKTGGETKTLKSRQRHRQTYLTFSWRSHKQLACN